MMTKLANIFNIYFLIALIPYICGLSLATFLNLVPIIPISKDSVFWGLVLGCFLSIASGISIMVSFLIIQPFTKKNLLNSGFSQFIITFLFSFFLFSLSFLVSMIINELESRKPSYDFILFTWLKTMFVLKIGQFAPICLLPRLYLDYKKSQNKNQERFNKKQKEKIKLLQAKIILKLEDKEIVEQQYQAANNKLIECKKSYQNAIDNHNDLLAEESLKQQTYYDDQVLKLKIKQEEIDIQLNELNRELEKVQISIKANDDDEIKTMWLEKKVLEKQEELVELRQFIARYIANQKTREQMLIKAQTNANQWQKQAEQAQQAGDEALVSECLKRKQDLETEALDLKAQIDLQAEDLELQKKYLREKEDQVSQMRFELDTLKLNLLAKRNSKS